MIVLFRHDNQRFHKLHPCYLFTIVMYMKTVNVAEARVQLSALLDEAVATHEEVTITRKGHPVAVVMSFDEYEALHENLFWLAHRNPDEPPAEQIKAEAARGDYPTVEQVQQDLLKAGVLRAPAN